MRVVPKLLAALGLVGPWMAGGARGDVFNLPQGQTSLSLVYIAIIKQT
jgi:hypothetical protein